jgi:two-component system, NarL family, nitrate/nitrite response regulator NarL
MRRTVPTVVVGVSTLLREGVARIINSAGFRVVVSKPSMSELDLESLPQSDAWLLIIECADNAQSLTAQIAAAKKKFSHVRIALLGRHWGTSEISAAFQAGANAYFAEATASDEFVKAIGLIMLGNQAVFPIEIAPRTPGPDQQIRPSQVYLPKPVGSFAPARESVMHLSPRETSILRCLARGASNKLIGREIKISEATVKVHVKAILRKIGVANRTQAAVWAMSNADWTAEHPEIAELALHSAALADARE